MTELEGKNSLLGTDLVHKTDQQQLLQATVRQETCTQENCITVERENYLGASGVARICLAVGHNLGPTRPTRRYATAWRSRQIRKVERIH